MDKAHQQRTPGWKACSRMLGRLQDPHDTQAAWLVACALLVFEAALCPLIIAKVPCAPSSCSIVLTCICPGKVQLTGVWRAQTQSWIGWRTCSRWRVSCR